MTDMLFNPRQEPVLDPALYFRASDRLRLEGCVAALVRDGTSLALSSSNEGVLDHYGAMLVTRLRQDAVESQLEVYFPASAEAMLARFNESLAQQSLSQAMEPGQGVLTSKIWVVPDAGALAEHELQLMARLVQNFPGANIRLVLFLGAGVNSRKAFHSFGRHILRWDMETPTQEQAETMLSHARVDGYEGQARFLLKKVMLPGYGADNGLQPDALVPVPVLAVDESRATLKHLAPASRRGEGGAMARRRSHPLRWMSAIAFLALISVSAAAWLHPGLLNLDRWGLSLRSSVLGKPVASQPSSLKAVGLVVPSPVIELTTPTEAAVNSPVTTTSSPVPLVTAAELIASLPPVASPAVFSSGPLPAKPAAPASSAVKPSLEASTAVLPASAQTERPVSTALAALNQEDLAMVELPAEAAAGQAWVKAMPTGTFLVQHAATPRFQDAMQWRQRFPALDKAKVVAVRSPNDKLWSFVVLSGPYVSLLEAVKYSKNPGLPLAAQIRSARSLKAQFKTPSEAGQESR